MTKMKRLILIVLMILPTQAYAGVTACGGEAAACGGSTLFAGMRARHAQRVDRRVQRRASRLACGGLSSSTSCAGSTTTGCGGSAVVAVQTVTVAAAPCEATCESQVVLGVKAQLPLVANSSSRNVGRFQQEAEWEAQQMASRGIKNHIRGTIAGVRMAGVGWSSGGTPSTCTPGRGGTCVADAIARGSDGLYRVRYYR